MKKFIVVKITDDQQTELFNDLEKLLPNKKKHASKKVKLTNKEK